MLESIPLGTWVLICVGHVLVCALVYWDSSNHCDYGWLWFICCVFCPPIALVYFVLRLVANRGAGAKEEFRRKLERMQQGPRTISEIERLHYLSLVSEGAGTMHEEVKAHHGYRHFVDRRAEAFIDEGRYEQAFEYLIELYTEAKANKDGVRKDTYLYYISLLPDGMERLEMLEGMNNDRTQGGSKPPF